MPSASNEKYTHIGHSDAASHELTQRKRYEASLENNNNVTRQIDEFFKTRVFNFAWHYLKSRFGKRHPYQYYPSEGDTGVYHLTSDDPIEIKIALLSDWANDTIESDKIAKLVADSKPDYTLHLGDVYFVGTKQEIEVNFTAPNASWYYGPKGSLTLPGNHEMYSNGNAFFKHLLKAMYVNENGVKKTQKAGFFCLENDFWRIIGLDTGYTSVKSPLLEIVFHPDCHLRQEQVDWLKNEVKIGDPTDKRGLIFLSHHPLITGFRKPYHKPAQQIQNLLGDAIRPVVWYWGHEHRLIWYKKQVVADKLPIYGRCVGVGGMPVETSLPDEQVEIDKMLYYDRRIKKKIRSTEIGYNGYTSIKLNNNKFSVEYIDITNEKVMEEFWEIDIQTGQLTWTPYPTEKVLLNNKREE